MGVVYKCHEMSLNRMVAMKLLAPHLAKDENFLKRFKREARAVAQLSHPNVVTIFNIGHHDDAHFIVMEYVNGQALSDMILQRGKLDLQTALQIARQIALALDAAHRVNIVHRDIKPHNVMVDSDGRAKVMDFGIAKVEEDLHSGLTNTGQVLGTPHYMSPEQLRGEVVDGRSDVFALGVTLYEMISGSLPFSGHTAVVVIQKILFEPPRSIEDYLETVPQPLLKILERAMAKNRDDRYATAAEMALDIQRALTGSNSGGMADFEPIPNDVTLKQTGFLDRVRWQWNHLERKKRISVLSAIGGAVLGALVLALITGGNEPKSSASNSIEPMVIELPKETAPPPVINLPPTVSALVDRTVFRTDEFTTFTASATDAEGDPFQLEHRLDEGIWQQLPLEGITLSALEPGTHTLEVRAADDLGNVAEPWRTVISVTPDRVTEALSYYSGSAGRVDEARARELITEASEAGDPIASMWLAWLTHWGRCGVPKDPNGADAIAKGVMEVVSVKADTGDSDAQFLVGAAYDQGIGVEENTTLASQWITLAAEAGESLAMNYLGFMHTAGRGVAKDSTVAAQWFTRGAEAGDVGAMHNLGWMYARGEGVERDDAQALAWFQRGADLGSPRHMGSLAYMYQLGQGTEKNMDEAKRLYKLAAAMGDETAQKNLKSLGETW